MLSSSDLRGSNLCRRIHPNKQGRCSPPFSDIPLLSKSLSASRNIGVAQEFAGKSQITTTEIYTYVLQEEMDKAVREAF